MLTPFSAADAEQVRHQLGRIPRGVVGVGARAGDGSVAVVVTKPRLDNGEPFPTTFYLTHPQLVKLISTIEAAGDMAQYQQSLTETSVGAAYRQAHEHYLQARAEIGAAAGCGEVAQIATVSAGGMPTRVKCLHALVAHALAAGPGINPIGDAVLHRLAREGSWTQPGWESEEEQA